MEKHEEKFEQIVGNASQQMTTKNKSMGLFKSKSAHKLEQAEKNYLSIYYQNECDYGGGVTIDVNYLMYKIFYLDEMKTTIYFNYSIFKQFACRESYPVIAAHFFTLLDEVVSLHGQYKMEIDLKSLTISAVERHLDFVKKYFNPTVMLKYQHKLEYARIHNPPSMIQNMLTLLGPLIPTDTRRKIVVV